MPTYEYACKDCGQHLEVVQSFSDDPLTTCSACGGRLRKVFSAAGIIFKGSGYYVTDSRAKKSGAAASDGASGGKKAADDAGSGSGSGEARTGDSADSGSTGSKSEKSGKSGQSGTSESSAKSA